jgi:hypothetical protein
MFPLATLRFFKLARALLIFVAVYGVSSALFNLDFSRALGMAVFSLYGLMTLGASMYWCLQLVDMRALSRRHVPGLLLSMGICCIAAALVANTLGTLQGLLLLPCGMLISLTRIRKIPTA